MIKKTSEGIVRVHSKIQKCYKLAKVNSIPISRVISINIFLPMADDQTFSVVVSKVQNEQGIFVVCSLEVSLRIISFRPPFGLPA